MNMKTIVLFSLLFLAGCASQPATRVTTDFTVADALATFRNSTTLGTTTQGEFVARFGKGQDWMRGNMPNAKGVSQFCWTLIFRQTDGTVYVNFSSDDLNEPMENWTLYSITHEIGRQQSASPATPDEDIEIKL
jgi:hypothetical protein